MKIPIHETFQQTIQGEGFHSGMIVDFIRLSGCPVRCPWCDTGYSDGGKNAPRSMIAIDDVLSELKSEHVVISGGEPLIHSWIGELCLRLLDLGRIPHIETSGGFWQDIPSEVWVTVSPKEHVNPAFPVVQEIWDRANEIKIVISEEKDLSCYIHRISTNKPFYLQPEWNNKSALGAVMNLLATYPHMRLSLQTHKLIGVQ